MPSPIVSIIAPVYGVERYLETCINSVLNQTYPHFELLLVDDRSPDNSPAICDRYAAIDDRIRVIHKPENQGLGFARNTGLENVTGEYVLFIDSDDYIENNLLEKALAAFEENTQFVVFGFNRVHQDEQGEVTHVEKLSPETAAAATPRDTADVFAMLNRAKVFPFAWNKLYKRSFLEQCGTLFEKTKLIEDFLFNIDLFAKASFINTIPDNLYNYRKPAHETLVSAYAPEFFDLCKRKYSLERAYLQTVEAETPEYCQLLYFSYVKHLVSVFLKNRSPKAALSAKQQRQKIREVLNDEMTKEVLTQYQPQGLVMKLVSFLFKKKMVALSYWMVAVGAKYI